MISKPPLDFSFFSFERDASYLSECKHCSHIICVFISGLQVFSLKKVNIVHFHSIDGHNSPMKKQKSTYHHGNLAESLLDAVDEIATQFGLEAVTLRACAKRIGVSPSSAFRHYSDKRALLTAFATRALHQLSAAMSEAKQQVQINCSNDKSNDSDTNHNQPKAQHSANNERGDARNDEFCAVGMAYVEFALNKPAFFRAMWREETIYTHDEHYVAAANQLSAHLQGGFANTIVDKDPNSFSPQELLAWSSVHGLANLFIEGPVGKDKTKAEKLEMAQSMIHSMAPAFYMDEQL